MAKGISAHGDNIYTAALYGKKHKLLGAIEDEQQFYGLLQTAYESQLNSFKDAKLRDDYFKETNGTFECAQFTLAYWFASNFKVCGKKTRAVRVHLRYDKDYWFGFDITQEHWTALHDWDMKRYDGNGGRLQLQRHAA